MTYSRQLLPFGNCPEERKALLKDVYVELGRDLERVRQETGISPRAPYRWARTDSVFARWWEEQLEIKAKELDEARDYYLDCFKIAYLDCHQHLGHASAAIDIPLSTLRGWIADEPEVQQWILLQRLLDTERGEIKLWQTAMAHERKDGGRLLQSILERRRESFYYIKASGSDPTPPAFEVLREDHALVRGQDGS